MFIIGLSAGRETGSWHEFTSTFKHRNLWSHHKGNKQVMTFLVSSNVQIRRYPAYSHAPKRLRESTLLITSRLVLRRKVRFPLHLTLVLPILWCELVCNLLELR